MTLNDVIKYYKDANDLLCVNNRYFKYAKSITQKYFNTSRLIINYENDEREQEICEIYASIAKLNTFSSDLYAFTHQLYMLPKNIPNLSSWARSTIELIEKVSEISGDLLIEHFHGNSDYTNFDFFFSHLQNIINSLASLNNNFYFLTELEQALYEPLPDYANEENLLFFEIRSYKNSTNLAAFSLDLDSLSKFITQLESILKPKIPLYIRKVESGSLRFSWSGSEMEISCISDIINAIVNGIRSLAFLPSDIRQKKQENQKLEIENESQKLAIINSQIDIISEKLGLDKNVPADRETIQRLLIPLINYLENNPVGNINGSDYNIKDNLKLLTCNDSDVTEE